MCKPVLALLWILIASSAGAQDGTAPVATDVTSAEIQAFVDALPRDRVSDRPMRVVEVTGDYRVGVYGVYRPQELRGGGPTSTTSTPPRSTTCSKGLPPS